MEKNPISQRLLFRLFQRDQSSSWMLILSYSLELMIIVLKSDPTLNLFSTLRPQPGQLWILYLVIFSILALQILFSYSMLRMFYFLLIDMIVSQSFSHSITLAVLVFLTIIIDVIKTTDSNFMNQIADLSDRIKICHYLILTLHQLRKPFLEQKGYLNYIILALLVLMLLYRISLPRKSLILKLFHQNLYLLAIIFLIEQFSQNQNKPYDRRLHIIVIGTTVFVFNSLFLIYESKRNKRFTQLNQKESFEAFWWMFSVLCSNQISLSDQTLIENTIRNGNNKMQLQIHLPKLQIPTRHIYLKAIVRMFDEREYSFTTEFLIIKSQVQIHINKNPFLSILFYEKALNQIRPFAVFDRIHLQRIRLEVFNTLENLRSSNFDFFKYMKNQCVIEKMKQCADCYHNIWIELANAEYCVFQELQLKINRFIQKRKEIQSLIKNLEESKIITTQTMQHYANFASLVEKDPIKTELILQKSDRTPAITCYYDHSKSLSLQVSLMEGQLGDIVSIGSNCFSLLGYRKQDLKNINMLVPQNLRTEHFAAIQELLTDCDNSAKLYRHKKTTFLEDEEGFCQQVGVQLNLVYDFKRLVMMGRLIFGFKIDRFKSHQRFYPPPISDEIISSCNNQIENQQVFYKEVSIGQKSIQLFTMKIIDSDLKISKQQKSIVVSHVNQQSGFWQVKENEEKSSRSNKSSVLIVTLICLNIALLANNSFKFYVCNDRLGAQQQFQQLTSTQVLNEFQIYQTLIMCSGIQIKKQIPFYDMEIDQSFAQILNENKQVNRKVGEYFPLITTQLIFGVQAKTNLFLQVSKLNAAASSALTYGLINQNELLAQANQQLFKATYENLLEVMHNAEVITDNLHILKKKILQLSGQKKFYYEVLHIAGFSLTLIFVFSLVLLLVRARIQTDKQINKLNRTMMLLTPTDISFLIRGAKEFQMIVNGLKVEELLIQGEANRVLNQSSIKSSSFSNIDSNMEFRMNTDLPLKLTTYRKSFRQNDPIIGDKQKEKVKNQRNKSKRKGIIFNYFSLTFILGLITTLATLPFLHSRLLICGLGPYLQNQFNLQSLRTYVSYQASSYFYLYVSFLQYSLSSFTNSAYYLKALAKYPTIRTDYAKYDVSLSNNPSFTDLNVFKFNVDYANIDTYTDSSELEILINPQWRNLFLRNTVMNSVNTAVSIIQNIVRQKAPLSDQRYHVLMEIFTLYITIFQKLLKFSETGSSAWRSSLFSIQKAYYWVQCGLLIIIFIFIVLPVCQMLISARFNTKIVFGLLHNGMFSLSKTEPYDG